MIQMCTKFEISTLTHYEDIQEGLAMASIARDVGSSSTNHSSDIMHFLPRLLKKTLQHERLCQHC